MKVVVIGSGLAGVTTAYLLARRGHEVTVVDRQEGPGREASFANGALLTPSMSEPWNAPGCWRVLLGSLGRSDAALQLRLRALPSLLGWGFAFLRHSSAAIFERNTLINLRLCLYSLDVMNTLVQQTGIEYGRTKRGALKIFRNAAAWGEAAAVAHRRKCAGLEARSLSRLDTVQLEPALAPIADRLAGSIHYAADETGDAHQFCVALTHQARMLGVTFHFATDISAFEVSAGRVVAARSASIFFAADHLVIAAGSYSTLLMRKLAVKLPVRPVKGYSVTLKYLDTKHALGLPIIDDEWHTAVVPLNGVIRVAGTAEFAGYSHTLDGARAANLTRFLRQLLPQERLDQASATPWCGLRAMTTDGLPLVGSTPIPNVTINTGHGHLGWTMAAGSAQLLCDLISGEPPRIDPTPFALTRFG